MNEITKTVKRTRLIFHSPANATLLTGAISCSGVRDVTHSVTKASGRFNGVNNSASLIFDSHNFDLRNRRYVSVVNVCSSPVAADSV